MRRQEKIFIRKAVLLTLIFIAFILTLNQLYKTHMEKQKVIHMKHTEWEGYKETLPDRTLRYAIFGDSHAERAINPRYLGNSYNFGRRGEDYVESYYKLRSLLDDDIRIESILLQADLHTFSDKMRTDEALFRELTYFGRFVPLKEIASLKGKSRLTIFLNYHIPVFGQGYELFATQSLSSFELGYSRMDGNFSLVDREKGARDRFIAHFNSSYSLMNQRSLQYFLKTVELAAKNDIRIILIIYPVTKEYDDEINRNGISRDRFYSWILSNMEEVTENYKILDYYNTFHDSPELFYDGDHLNWAGAEIFSKIVLEDLQELSDP